MALADIRKKIEQDALNEAQKLLEQAKAQAASIEAEAEAEINKSANYYDKLYADEAPEIKRRAQIVAGIDIKKLMLGAKQNLISESFENALDILCNMPKDKYLDFISKLLDKAIIDGDEEIIVGKNEKYINQDFINIYNIKGKNIKLSSEKIDIKGGFILRRNKVSENCSLETLVRWLKDELEAGAAKRLFDAE